jgi:hypothetical protein
LHAAITAPKIIVAVIETIISNMSFSLAVGSERDQSSGKSITALNLRPVTAAR